MLTQLPTVVRFSRAENNSSKSSSYPKRVFSIQMSNFAAARAGHLSVKDYPRFVSSLLVPKRQPSDSTPGNLGNIPQMQRVFLEVWFSRGHALKYIGFQIIFPRCDSEIFWRSKCIFTEVCICVFSRSANISRSPAGISRRQTRHAIRLIVKKAVYWYHS